MVGKECHKEEKIIIYTVKSQYWRTSHKFGIALPHSVEEASKLDKQSGNNLWRIAIDEELKKIRSMGTFEMMEGISPDKIRLLRYSLPGYKEIGYHLIFDVKLDGKFTRNVRLVANSLEIKCIPK